MKKQIKEFTIEEVKKICKDRYTCRDCPFAKLFCHVKEAVPCDFPRYILEQEIDL